jgi:hypothetical protein
MRLGASLLETGYRRDTPVLLLLLTLALALTTSSGPSLSASSASVSKALQVATQIKSSSEKCRRD